MVCACPCRYIRGGAFHRQFFQPMALQLCYKLCVPLCNRKAVAKTRRGKRQNLVTHILVFMDDIIIFASSKHNAKAAGKALEEYMHTQLGLHIKPNHNIKQTAKEPPDIMGYVVRKECTTIRARTFVRARRALLRAWRRMVSGLPIYLKCPAARFIPWLFQAHKLKEYCKGVTP